MKGDEISDFAAVRPDGRAYSQQGIFPVSQSANPAFCRVLPSNVSPAYPRDAVTSALALQLTPTGEIFPARGAGGRRSVADLGRGRRGGDAGGARDAPLRVGAPGGRRRES